MSLPRAVARGRRGAAGTGHPLATAAALRAFEAGGSAVDAAVAAAYALFVVLPDACGVGGDALFTVRAPSAELVSFNGAGAAPAGFGGSVPEDGAGTTTVPGAVAALADAHARFGSLPCAFLVAPAVRYAREGFPLHDSLVEAIARQRPRLEARASAWEGLAARRSGGVLRQPGLARLVESIGARGRDAFYEGPVAAAIERAARSDEAELSAADLASHETVVASPLSVRYRGMTVHGQPPVTQAVLGLMALKLLDRLDDPDPVARNHAAIEVLEAAFEHRDQIADPAAAAALLDLELAVDGDRAQRRGGPSGQAHTTAVACAGADGMVVTMVVSVFDEFGCSRLVPEHGIFLNNRMKGFSADPSSPNAAGPGKRPVHTLSPMLREGGGVALALATPGADGQVQTLTQLLELASVRGLGHTAALDAARWRTSDGVVTVEEGFDPSLADSLAQMGHEIRWAARGGRPFGAAVLAGFDANTESVFAAADLRRDAWAGAC